MIGKDWRILATCLLALQACGGPEVESRRTKAETPASESRSEGLALNEPTVVQLTNGPAYVTSGPNFVSLINPELERRSPYGNGDFYDMAIKMAAQTPEGRFSLQFHGDGGGGAGGFIGTDGESHALTPQDIAMLAQPALAPDIDGVNLIVCDGGRPIVQDYHPNDVPQGIIDLGYAPDDSGYKSTYVPSAAENLAQEINKPVTSAQNKIAPSVDSFAILPQGEDGRFSIPASPGHPAWEVQPELYDYHPDGTVSKGSFETFAGPGYPLVPLANLPLSPETLAEAGGGTLGMRPTASVAEGEAPHASGVTPGTLASAGAVGVLAGAAMEAAQQNGYGDYAGYIGMGAMAAGALADVPALGWKGAGLSAIASPAGQFLGTSAADQLGANETQKELAGAYGSMAGAAAAGFYVGGPLGAAAYAAQDGIGQVGNALGSIGASAYTAMSNGMSPGEFAAITAEEWARRMGEYASTGGPVAPSSDESPVVCSNPKEQVIIGQGASAKCYQILGTACLADTDCADNANGFGASCKSKGPGTVKRCSYDAGSPRICTSDSQCALDAVCRGAACVSLSPQSGWSYPASYYQ